MAKTLIIAQGFGHYGLAALTTDHTRKEVAQAAETLQGHEKTYEHDIDTHIVFKPFMDPTRTEDENLMIRDIKPGEKIEIPDPVQLFDSGSQDEDLSLLNRLLTVLVLEVKRAWTTEDGQIYIYELSDGRVVEGHEGRSSRVYTWPEGKCWLGVEPATGDEMAISAAMENHDRRPNWLPLEELPDEIRKMIPAERLEGYLK